MNQLEFTNKIKYIIPKHEFDILSSYHTKSIELVIHILRCIKFLYVIETQSESFEHVELVAKDSSKFMLVILSHHYGDIMTIRRNDKEILVCEFKISGEIKHFTVVFYLAKNNSEYNTYKKCFVEKNRI